MATEKVNIIELEFGESVKTIGQLRNHIKELKKELDNIEPTSERFAEVQTEIGKAQKVMSDTLKGAQSNVAAAGDSYDALAARMRGLRKEWRATGDDAERAALGEQIVAINDKLKGFDASIGNYQRNVGNYSGSIVSAFEQIGKSGGAVGGIVQPIKNANNAMKLLAANPVGATITIIAGALNLVIGALKSSEKNTQQMSLALSSFKAIGDAVTKVVQGLGDALGKVAEWMQRLVGRLAENSEWAEKINEKMQQRIELEQELQAITQRTRDNIIANADAELKVSELRAKAADKTNYTARQRIEFLREAAKEEEGISQRNYDLARKEYEMLVLQHSLTESSTEELKEEADAYAKMQAAKKSYLDKTRELTAQIVEAQNTIKAEVKAAAAAAAAAAKKAADDELAAVRKTEDMRIAAIADRYDREQAQAETQAARQIADIQKRLDTESTLTTNARAALAEQIEMIEYDLSFRIEEINLARESEELAMQQERLAAVADEANAELEIRQQQADAEADIERRKLATRKASFAATRSLLNGLADLMEAQAEGDEKRLNRVRGIRAASAIIDTIAGAVAAFTSSIETYGQPAGPIIGAIQAAAVTASGMAEVAKIRSTNASSAGGGSSISATPVTSAPAIINEIPVTRSVTTASEDERTATQRVVLVYGDIQEADKRVEVVHDETTF